MTQKKLSEKELLNLVEQLGKDPSMKFTDLESDVQEQLLDLQKNWIKKQLTRRLLII